MSKRNRTYAVGSGKKGRSAIIGTVVKKRQRGGFKEEYGTIPMQISGTSQQAMRTGGWANPAQMTELKFKDVATTSSTLGVAAATFTTPGPTFLLNGLVPGSGADQRIGRRCTIKSLYIRATAALAPTTIRGCCVRFMVVYDKQANATAPAVTDILATDSFYSPNNLSNRDRFVVLVDHVTDAVETNANYLVAFTIYKKLNLETMFNAGTAGTIADITSGSLYVLAAQNGDAAIAAPVVTWYSRIRYSDM